MNLQFAFHAVEFKWEGFASKFLLKEPSLSHAFTH